MFTYRNPKIRILYLWDFYGKILFPPPTNILRNTSNLRGACIPLLVPELDQTPDKICKSGRAKTLWLDVVLFMGNAYIIQIYIYTIMTNNNNN
jgi:hypothetical protein